MSAMIISAWCYISSGLTKTDPAWVGAWWLGFVISSILSFTLAIFMFLFPREMPGKKSIMWRQLPFSQRVLPYLKCWSWDSFPADTKAIRAAKVSEAYDNGSEGVVNSVGFGMTWRDMPRATWYFISFLHIMVNRCLELSNYVFVSGFWWRIQPLYL